MNSKKIWKVVVAIGVISGILSLGLQGESWWRESRPQISIYELTFDKRISDTEIILKLNYGNVHNRVIAKNGKLYTQIFFKGERILEINDDMPDVSPLSYGNALMHIIADKEVIDGPLITNDLKVIIEISYEGRLSRSNKSVDGFKYQEWRDAFSRMVPPDYLELN